MTTLPAHPAALAQLVDQQLRTHSHRDGSPGVVLVRAKPTWSGDPVLTTPDGTSVLVVPCPSVLAVLEQVSGEHRQPCVVLTDIPPDELGIGIVSRVFRRRMLDMEPWALIAESFGAQLLDPRLETQAWAGRALLEAMPPQGWPKLSGPVLLRDTALRHLAAERLGLSRLAVRPEDIDEHTMLRWSTLPEAAALVAELPVAERTGLFDWLVDQFGPAVRVLRSLVEGGHCGDTLAIGLVCAALWADDGPEHLRGQGRVEQYLGGSDLDQQVIRTFGAAATKTVTDLLRCDISRPSGPSERAVANAALDRAEELATGFAATPAARQSPSMRSGFEQRLDSAAEALAAALATALATVLTGSAGDGPAGDGPTAPSDSLRTALDAAEAALAAMAAHLLAGSNKHRIERATMGLRLIRWLGLPLHKPAAMAAWIDRQVTELSWVDLAVDHVWAGEDAHLGLAAVYQSIYARVTDRRRELDRAFAGQLAAWTPVGSTAGNLMTIETVLPKVVAPLVRSGERSALVIVLDGMSTAVAADLVAQLTDKDWIEHDPVAGRKTAGRRHGAVAALPTITSASRASLLAADLVSGGQDSESSAFARLPMWQATPARLFHQEAVKGAAGKVLSTELVEALSDGETVVGVVLNTVDDALDHDRQSADPGWRIDQFGPLRALLEHARYHGRAVVLVSDHGHVLDRGSTMVRTAEPRAARYRTDPAPAGDGEVELRGQRVVGHRRIVALWDRDLRYVSRRAGYHGGVSLAEVTVPVIALLPFGAAPPPGWAALGPQEPPWWAMVTRAEPTDQLGDSGSGVSDGKTSGPAGNASGLGGKTSGPAGKAAGPGGKAAGPGAEAPKRARRSRPAPVDPAAICLFDLPPVAPVPTGPPAGPSSAGPAGPLPAGCRSGPAPASATVPPAASPASALIDELIATELFTAQHTMTARKVPLSKVRGALTALIEANGVLPAAVAAQRAGELPHRAIGFVTTLQRILNVDNYLVLSLTDAGRTVRLDQALLRQQFGLWEGR